ncbi:MAG: hypothetical protein AAF543_03555 [Pseudomonadota bacterium]
MSAKLIGKVVLALLATAFLAGCDDDDDKKTRYKIEIEMTDNVDWEIRTIKGKTKPEVTVSYPKGVEVRGRETKPAKTVSFDVLPIGLALLTLLLAPAVLLSSDSGNRSDRRLAAA